MPLTQAALEAKVRNGKPFITGQFLGMSISEMMCKVKGNPNVKENRVVRKFTIQNRNGMHVFSNFLGTGSKVEKNVAGDIVKVIDEKGVEVLSALKLGQEVCVDLFAYERDGVGIAIMGDISPV